MPYCPDCGEEVGELHRYCGDCGMPLEANPTDGTIQSNISHGFLSPASTKYLIEIYQEEREPKPDDIAFDRIEDEVRAMLEDFAILGKVAGPFSLGSVIDSPDDPEIEYREIEVETRLHLMGLLHLLQCIETSFTELDEVLEVIQDYDTN